VASELLYLATAQQFTGSCGPVKIRPRSRPTDLDTRAFGTRIFPNGYLSSWGLSSAWGMAANGALNRFGSAGPPEIDLGAYPVSEILTVKIDGVVIPPNEYEIRDYRKLVRLRVSANTPPTQRWGWPTSQIDDLPDTELGTFSVEYLYGQPPPASGEEACAYFAAQLALNKTGSTKSRLPITMTAITRQGVSIQIPSAVTLLAEGRTGMYPVDVFIRNVNPYAATRKPMVWSPDVGRARRVSS